jgi:hypothetical protein
MLKQLQQAVINNDNVFAVLMDAVRMCSLGQITNALFEVGGSIGGACRLGCSGQRSDRFTVLCS